MTHTSVFQRYIKNARLNFLTAHVFSLFHFEKFNMPSAWLVERVKTNLHESVIFSGKNFAALTVILSIPVFGLIMKMNHFGDGAKDNINGNANQETMSLEILTWRHLFKFYFHLSTDFISNAIIS